jgi:mannan endo-1,4-beta-mannosidase
VLGVAVFAAPVFSQPAPASAPEPTSTPASTAASLPTATDWVTRDGPHFALDGTRFRFLGANLDVMHGAAAAGYADTLHGAVADGLTVARVWALGAAPADTPAPARDEYLWLGTSQVPNEPFARRLDQVLAEAGGDRLRLILVLENHWGDYGGVPEMLNELGLPADDTRTFGATDRFYSDPQARALYLARITALANRVNTVTGVAYKDDPTILSWELINESDVADAAGASARLAWIAEMAKALHTLDARHLVAAGVWGYASPVTRGEWAVACALPAVDYCDAHVYPEDDSAVTNETDMRHELDDPVALGHALGKPVILGELGFRTEGAAWLDRPADAWVTVATDELARASADGALLWIYQPFLGAPRSDGYGIYVDQESTDAVRTALRQGAAALAAADDTPANPTVAAWTLDAPPLFADRVARHGTVAAPSAWKTTTPTTATATTDSATGDDGAVTLELPVRSFATLSFPSGDAITSTPLEEVWASESGTLTFALPALPAGAKLPAKVDVQIDARVSSEYPGAVSPPDGSSLLEVRFDGVRVGTAVTVPDNGQGAWMSVHATVPLTAAGPHQLDLVVPPGAHGLCLYGLPTGNWDSVVGPIAGATGGVRVTLTAPK